MYKKISEIPSPAEAYQEHLVGSGVIKPAYAEKLRSQVSLHF